MALARLNDSAALVAAVRRDLFTAAADDNWTDEKILAIADDCLVGPVAAALKSAKQEWFARDFDLEIEEDTGEYDLPPRTMYGSIENAFLIDKTTGRIVSQLANASSSQREIFQPGNNNLSGTPQAVYFRDSSIVLSPAPDANSVSSYSVTLASYREPGQLCKTTEVVRVSSIAAASMTVTIGEYDTSTLAGVPASWTEGAYDALSGYRIDIYKGRVDPHSPRMFSVVGSLTAANTLRFDPAITLDTSMTAEKFAHIEVGDTLCSEYTTPYVDLPVGGVPFLRRMVQKTIALAQTDPQALQAYLSEEAGALANFMKGMKNRHDGKGRKISLYNAAGARFARRRW